MRQHQADRAFEIVVVDDGSVDAAAVERAVEKISWARLVRRPPGGTASARNSGVRAARAPFVAFTDDDCIPDPGWTEALRARLLSGAAVVAGATLNGCRGKALSAALQLVSEAGFDGRDGPWGAPASNLACRRDLLLEVPFDERYRLSAEDRDWYMRVAARIDGVDQAPEAVVRHFPQLTLRRFVAKQFVYGRGAHRFRRDHRSGSIEHANFYLGLLRTAFGSGLRTGLAVCLAQLATAAGFATEALLSSFRRSS